VTQRPPTDECDVDPGGSSIRTFGLLLEAHARLTRVLDDELRICRAVATKANRRRRMQIAPTQLRFVVAMRR
jgi:hypothetical protein